MKKRSLLSLIVAAACLCSCTAEQEDLITLELRYLSDAMPTDCSRIREIAESEFRQRWIAYLVKPAETVVVQSSTELSKTGPAKLAPVGSYEILNNELTFTNQFASVFISCNKREGYVLATGGYANQRHWYGPFKF
jgi:hypothetical protein